MLAERQGPMAAPHGGGHVGVALEQAQVEGGRGERGRDTDPAEARVGRDCRVYQVEIGADPPEAPLFRASFVVESR